MRHTEAERLMLREVLLTWRIQGWRDRDSAAINLSRALLRHDCTPEYLAAMIPRSFLQTNRCLRDRVVVVLWPLSYPEQRKRD